MSAASCGAGPPKRKRRPGQGGGAPENSNSSGDRNKEPPARAQARGSAKAPIIAEIAPRNGCQTGRIAVAVAAGDGERFLRSGLITALLKGGVAIIATFDDPADAEVVAGFIASTRQVRQ